METVQRGIAARSMAKVPAYADGGVVSPYSIRGIMNRAKSMMESAPAETVTQKYARQDAELAAKNPPAQSTPQKPNVIDAIKGHNKRMDEAMQSLKDGGPVKAGIIRGKGTGTSDSIKGTMPVGSFVMPKDSTDVMVSNGETHFTPDMLQKVGAMALMAMKDATHTPVAEQQSASGGSQKLAGGGLVDEERQRLANQNAMYIEGAKATAAANPQPTPPTPPAPAMSTERQLASDLPAPSSYGSQMRNVGNAIMGAPAEAIKTLVSAPGYGISAPAKVDPITQTAPAPVAAPLPNQAAPQTATAMAAPVTPVAPTTPTAPVGQDMGNGITKTVTNGKTLYSNVGEADNTALMGRGPVSAQNQMAMNGIQARQDAGDAATQQRLQYQSEVDSATKFREGQIQGGIQRRALNGNRNAMTMLTNQTTDATARRGQDITAAGQTATNQNAAARLGIDRTTAGLANQQTAQQIGAAKQMQDLQTKLLTAKPDERAGLEDNLRALQGKYEKAVPNRFTVVPGGTDDMGNKQASRVINNETGAFVDGAAPAKTSFESGKIYTDAKGNRATWNGTAFVPAK